MSIESVRFGRGDDERAPPAPPHFDHRYELPVHRVKLLERMHAHPRDRRIVFFEEPHIYTIDDLPVQASVSGLAAEYEAHFDPDGAIAAMKASKKVAWPRLQYVLGARRIAHVDEFDGAKGAMIVDAETDETLASSEPGVDASGIALYTYLADAAASRQRARAEAGETLWYVFDRSMTDDEIRRAWEDNGEDARNRGTEAHLQMELWFNSEPVRVGDGEVGVGLRFVRECLVPIGAKAYRTEWTIFGEEENVAGCIDLAVTLPSGDLYLVDWKRSEKLAQKMHGYRRMKAPLNHLDDCSGAAYAIQLSSYQYIIEKYYNKKVAGRALASIHPDAPFTTAVPYLAPEVEFLMATRRAMAAARKALSADDAEGARRGLVCTGSGMLVMDAVRDARGDLYDAKVAKLKAIEATPCEETTARARQLLADHTPAVALERRCDPWKKQFPKPTDDLLHYSQPL